ncbi:MAG: 3-oxoadipate enol-lactonase [Rhodobacteraceae bacterium]|nr:3-oxoadipate enol-lactonase [Paracoccaceae bacterium]
MHIATLDGLHVNYRIDGTPDGPPVVFSNSLATDLRLWDKIIPMLPQQCCYIRYDKRGHGLTDVTPGPYSMGMLVKDLESLLVHLRIQDAVVVGLSIGGMIAQGLAAKRLDLVRALVLSNTGAKIATRDIWAQRIETAKAGGMAALVDPTMQRWFSKNFQGTEEFHAWRNMFLQTSAEGYAACGAAIAGTDFITPTSALRLPVLGIAGNDDSATPPDLVRETANLVPGSKFELIRGSGHLSCVDAAEDYARIVTEFLSAIGHG